MADTTCHMSISLDGFVAGPEQSRDDPLGKGGIELHRWHLGEQRANDEDAASRTTQLKNDLATTYFAWYGPTASGSASYFRITGPHIVIEYSPQSMGGDATNHIDGIDRDPTNDYGGTVC